MSGFVSFPLRKRERNWERKEERDGEKERDEEWETKRGMKNERAMTTTVRRWEMKNDRQREREIMTEKVRERDKNGERWRLRDKGYEVWDKERGIENKERNKDWEREEKWIQRVKGIGIGED